MENQNVRFTQGVGWRVSTPSFPDCAAMDEFYAEAHRLIETNFAAEREARRRGTYAADFRVMQDGGDLIIELRMRAREGGRVTARKAIVHRWRGGNIAPGHKSPFIIISKIRLKFKRKSEKAPSNERASKNC